MAAPPSTVPAAQKELLDPAVEEPLQGWHPVGGGHVTRAWNQCCLAIAEFPVRPGVQENPCGVNLNKGNGKASETGKFGTRGLSMVSMRTLAELGPASTLRQLGLRL